MYRKITQAVVCIAMAAMLFSGCGSTSETATSTASSSAAEVTSEAVSEVESTISEKTEETVSSVAETAESESTDIASSEESATDEDAEESSVTSSDITSDESADDSADAGTVFIDGEKITLGMSIDEIQESTQWHLSSDAYATASSTMLEPEGYSENYYDLYNDKYGTDYSIRVSSRNESDSSLSEAAASIYDTVFNFFDSVDNIPEITFPGGITNNSSYDDLVAAYGEPSDSAENESGTSYLFVDGDVAVQVDFENDRIAAVYITAYDA